MKNTAKIGVCIPNEGSTRPEAYYNHLLWYNHLGILQEKSKQEEFTTQYEFFFFSAGRILTPYARELMAKDALAAELDYILMLDDDMIINDPDIFERLIAHDVDIVAPLAFMRNKPHYPVMYKHTEGYDAVVKSEYFKFEAIKNYPKNTLVECDSVGFGMVLIKTKVLEAMEQPYFMSTSSAGEDILFCGKAKKLGFRVFMDTSLKLGHIGTARIVTEETYEQMNGVDGIRDIYGVYAVKGRYTDGFDINDRK